MVKMGENNKFAKSGLVKNSTFSKPEKMGVFEGKLLAKSPKPHNSDVSGGCLLKVNREDGNTDFFQPPKIKTTLTYLDEKKLAKDDCLTEKQIIDFMRGNTSHLVDFEEIKDTFISYGEEVVYATLIGLRSKGDMIESKPGKWVLLE